MNGRSQSPFVFTPRDLDVELAFRDNQNINGTGVKGMNPALRYFTTGEIRKKYRQMMERSIKRKRGNWYRDKREELYKIKDKKVRRNAHSVTAVCMRRDLCDTDHGYWELKVERYEEIYHLCRCERFYGQPVAAGLMCTGVLVAPDVVATAAHFVRETNVRKLYFIFGYVMRFPGAPITRFPKENVYCGVEILQRTYDVDGPNATGSDWALVRLDRKVEGREIVTVSKSPAFRGQSLYVLGHPCSLPLKYAPGGMVKHIENAYFTSEIDLYSGNSGSPVFCAETHEMIGIVSGSDPIDFDWDDDCCGYISVTYPHKKIKSHGGRCVKASEFNEYIDRR
jgi:V8-like Glu-specific endopeptidase